MEAIPKCEEHKTPFARICSTCRKKLCHECVAIHVKQCPGSIPVDFPTYAKENLLPEYKKRLDNLEKCKPLTAESMKEFMVPAPTLKKLLILLQEKVESLLKLIKNALEYLDKKPMEPSKIYENAKNEYLKQFDNLRIAIENEDINYIIKTLEIKEIQAIPGWSEEEKKLIEATNAPASRLIESKDFDALNECLQNLHGICKKAFSENYLKGIVPVKNQFVYGTCNPKKSRKELCKYDINTKKLKSVIAVPQLCAVLQILNKVFITGGSSPLVSTTSEYNEENNSLISKSNMNYPKYYHSMIAISNTQFWTVSGYGKTIINYCEEYSIPENKWNILPPLNQERYAPALSILGNYVYVIGGCSSFGSIERMEIKSKKQWYKVFVSTNELKLDDENDKAAFSISETEIIIFCGGNGKSAGIYNPGKNEIKKCEFSLIVDYHQCNSVAIIDSNAYIIGGNGNVHKYSVPDKKYEGYNYSAINA